MDFVLSVLIFLSVFLKGNEALSCWQQICHECPSNMEIGPYVNVECDFGKLISENSLGGWSGPHNVPPQRNADYVCLKLVGTNTQTYVDSTDVIRGCALRLHIDELCTRLKGIEKARNKEVVCSYCYGDNCNDAQNIMANIVLVSITTLSLFFFNK